MVLNHDKNQKALKPDNAQLGYANNTKWSSIIRIYTTTPITLAYITKCLGSVLDVPIVNLNGNLWNTIEHKTLVDSELQENWWRKFWWLVTLIIVHYYNIWQIKLWRIANCPPNLPKFCAVRYVIVIPYSTKLWQFTANSLKFYPPKSCEVLWTLTLNELCLCQPPKFSPPFFLQFQFCQSFVLYDKQLV